MSLETKVINKTVLIAEDEYMMLKTLDLFFTNMGFNTVLARDGEDALTKFANNEVDLVCTDLIMPYKSGLDVLKEAKLKSSDLPVFIFTALEDDLYQELAKANGVDVYTYKPVSENIIKEYVDKVLF